MIHLFFQAKIRRGENKMISIRKGLRKAGIAAAFLLAAHNAVCIDKSDFVELAAI